MTNFYKTLGLKNTATQEEIKTAYKNLIKKYHPDLYQGDKAYAERKTKELNLAYETLSDPDLRRNYDLELFPPTPTSGYYSSSSDNYSYTPPKYDTPPTDYYTKYKNNYSNPGREYNYNDFANYQTDKRYTDYHRQKTPSSDYKDQRKTEDVSSKMMGIYDKLTSGKRFLAILAVLIAYCALVMTTISKFNLVFSGKETGPLLNEENPTELFVPEVPEELPPSSEQSLPLREDFDIHDYMSEQDLLTLYNSRFKDEFNTYDEFKEWFVDAFYDVYVNY